MIKASMKMKTRYLMSLKTNLAKSNIEQLLSQHYEKELQKRLGKVFHNMGKEVIKELEEYYNPGDMATTQLIDLILAPIHELHHEYYTTLSRYTLKEYDRSRKSAKRITGYARKIQSILDNQNKQNISFKSSTQVPIPQLDLNPDKENLFGTLHSSEQDLMDRTYKFSESTLQRVDQDIHQIIKDGYNEGKGINVVRDDIQKRFNELQSWEAQRIARTEINISHNMGIIQGYQDMDVEYIQWTAARDERTRTSHREIDGEIIPLGATFSNNLRHPGDPNGTAAEVINCRCVASPFIIPDGYMAPPGKVPFREDDLVKVDVQPIEELTKPKPVPPKEPITPSTPKTKTPKTQVTPTKEPKPSTANTFETIFKGEPKVYESTELVRGKNVTVYEYGDKKIVFDSDKAALTFDEVKAHINSLPPAFAKTELRQIYIHDYAHPRIGGEYTSMGHMLTIYKPNGATKSQILDTFTHELAHSLDLQARTVNGRPKSIFAYSNKETYEKIFKADNKLYTITRPNGRKRTPKKFPTDYARDSYRKFKRSKEPLIKEKIFVEDFAESSKLYLNPSTHEQFVKDFPNRAEYLKGIYGKPKFNKDSLLYKELVKEGKLTKPEQIVTVTPKENPNTLAPKKSVQDLTRDDYEHALTKSEFKRYETLKKQYDHIKEIIKRDPSDIRQNQLKLYEKELKHYEEKALQNPAPIKEPEPIINPADHTKTMEEFTKETPLNEESIEKLEKWSGKRLKNKREYGYAFDTKTGEVVGEEIKGGKESILLPDAENIGSIHTHHEKGFSFPSIEDIATARAVKGEYHYTISDNEIWEIQAKEKLGVMSTGGQIDVMKAYNTCFNEGYAEVEALVKAGKLKPNEVKPAANKIIGDKLLQEFNKPVWKNKGFKLTRVTRNKKVITKATVKKPVKTVTPKKKSKAESKPKKNTTSKTKPKKETKPKTGKTQKQTKPKETKTTPTETNKINPIKRGAKAKTTTDTYEGGLYKGLKTVEYEDGTVIKFKKQANDYDPDYPFQTLDEITIDGKTYKYHDKDVYDIFKYQDERLTPSEQKFADEWIEKYGTAAGKQFNDYKRGKLTPEQIKKLKEDEDYGGYFRWLLEHEKEYNKILEKSVIKEDIVSMRIQAHNYAKPDATQIIEKGYTSSSVGINRSDLVDTFGNARDVDSNWTILQVTPKGTKGARFQGNSIARNEGDVEMDFERELTYKQNMKWDVLIRDEENKIMVLMPSG